MWCGQCGHEGPAVPAADDPDAIVCLNCRTTYTETSSTQSGRVTRVDSSHLPGNSGTWQEPDVVEPPPIVDDDDFWFEPEELHDDVAAVPLLPARLPDKSSQSERRRRRRRRHRRSALICWTMLSIGVALFVCGASLIGWSLLEERDELWNIGAPIVLAGQATFLIGLVLQLDGIWHQSRAASKNLDELDERLSALQALQKGELSEQGDPAHTFYQHVAEGASPQMLLTDLKGQLDLIADRLARQDK